MNIVNVPNVTQTLFPREGDISSSAVQLANDQFIASNERAAEALENANTYLSELWAVLTGVQANMPETNITYDYQKINLTTPLETLRPEPPTDEQLTPADITSPKLLQALTQISVPDIIDMPADNVGELESQVLDYVEVPYASDIADALKTLLLDYIANGGTGLGADVEAALFARARARTELSNERIYEEAEEYFSSRGWDIPPDTLGGRLTEALQEITRADEQVNYEITIEQARLAQNNTQFALTTSLGLEGQDKEQANQIADRALEKAKAAVDVILNTYNAKMVGFLNRIEAVKASAMAAEATVNAQAAMNTSIVEVYKADIEKYSQDVIKELGIVELIGKVYGFKVQGYEADSKAAAVLLDAEIKEYQGRIEQANNQTQLSIKEAELILQTYLSSLSIDTEGLKTLALITSQIAASALSGVSASASLGSSVSNSKSESIGATTAISAGQTGTERHNYEYTGT